MTTIIYGVTELSKQTTTGLQLKHTVLRIEVNR